MNRKKGTVEEEETRAGEDECDGGIGKEGQGWRDGAHISAVVRSYQQQRWGTAQCRISIKANLR